MQITYSWGSITSSERITTRFEASSLTILMNAVLICNTLMDVFSIANGVNIWAASLTRL